MLLKNIKDNLKSGLTVSLISIPLSISLAVASGATPMIGIITAIWAGLIASIFGGSNFNIVGPTGALSGIIATYVFQNSLSGLPMLALIAGVIIIIAYILKLERYLILIPSSVIHGFTLGVAFVIGLGQFNSALGLKGLPAHETFFENLIESLQHVSNISWTAFIVFAIFLAGLLILKKYVPKIPGAIILAPIGILLGYFSSNNVINLPSHLRTLGDQFPTGMDFRLFGNFSFSFSSSMLQTAAVIALIAILETMLSAKIADGMTRTKHNARKEMLGLGLANVVSGLVGGMPATAALARTSLNIKTGATHKTSAMVNTVGIVAISAFLINYFKFIPMAVIAAILVSVAIRMVEREHYNKLWIYERSGFYVSILVAVATIVIDPIVGILLGVSISLLIFVNHISRGYYDLTVNKFNEGIVDSDSGVRLKEIEEDADVLLYSIRGKLCYINSRAHIERFEGNFMKYKHIILRLREVNFVDTDGSEALDEIIDLVQKRGQEVILTGANQRTLGLLEQISHGYKDLKQQGLVFDKSEQALTYLGVPVVPKAERKAHKTTKLKSKPKSKR